VNILEGKVVAREDGLWRIASRAAGTSLVVDDPDEVLENEQAVDVAIRPEKVKLTRQPPTDGRNVLAGEVWDIGYVGDWTIYRVKLDSGATVRVSSANVSRFVDAPVTWDERVYLSFAPQAAVILTR
jgi:putrescine transport system ATP-binding protein